MKRLFPVSLVAIIVLLARPSLSWASPVFTYQVSQYAFPFLPVWVGLYITWTLLQFLWFLGSVIFKWKPPPINPWHLLLGLFLFMVILSFTLFLPLLFLWAILIAIRLWWAARKPSGEIPATNPRVELVFHGVFAVLMIVSIPIMYWRYNQTEKLVGRLGNHAMRGVIYTRLKALGDEVSPHLKKELVKGINQPDKTRGLWVAIDCVRLLGEIKDAGAVDLMIKCLDIPNKKSATNPNYVPIFDLHQACADALIRIGDRGIIKPLKGNLTNPDYDAYSEVFKILIAMGDLEAMPYAIKRISADKLNWYNNYLTEYLSMITGVSFGFDQTAWQKWWDKNEATWQIPLRFIGSDNFLKDLAP